jgi:ActR/RegA family two-component response regulator
MDLQVLFIEDDEKIAANLTKIFNNEMISGNRLSTSSITSFEEAMVHLEQSDYDMVVLDLQKEGNNFDEMAGVKILEAIKKTAFIPVIFYTGHAGKVQDLISEIVGVVNKGDGVKKLKEEMQRIIDSKIALLKGNVYNHLRESLRKYFWETVDAQKAVFVPGNNDVSLGYLLLRRFANSLSKENIKQLLGDDKIKTDKAHPMEFYIFPSGSGEYEAGEILSREGVFYTVLTPTCDFVEEGARKRKVGKVLLARTLTLKETEFFKKYESNKEKYKQSLAELIESRKGDRYFFLPGTPFLPNLLLDFQNKVMYDYEELKDFTRIAKLDDPYAQSMIASFIRYYNRIGFPDIDSDYVINNL